MSETENVETGTIVEVWPADVQAGDYLRGVWLVRRVRVLKSGMVRVFRDYGASVLLDGDHAVRVIRMGVPVLVTDRDRLVFAPVELPW